MLPHGANATAEPPTRPGRAVVFVREPSPFLSAAAVEQRVRRCVAVAQHAGLRAFAVDRPAHGDAVDRLRSVLASMPGTVLVTWSAHGLIRTPAELDFFTDALGAGLRMLAAHSGALRPVELDDLRSGALPGRDVESERRLHAERTHAGRHAVARAGRWLGGRAPVGWVVHEDGSATLDEQPAIHIAIATQRVGAGAPIGPIVAQWNHAGFRTSTGRLWTAGSARRVLLRARNAGLIEYRGDIVGRSVWPAIVTVAEWRRCYQALSRTRRNRESA